MKYRVEFLEKYNEILKYIKEIDELIYFKTQYKDWVDYISKKKVKTSTKYLENDIFNPILSSSYYKDNLLDKFLSTNEAFNEIKKIQKGLSLVNKRNIILILTQTFFYNSLLTSIFPFLYYYEYIGANNDYSFYLMNIFVFIVVLAAYLGQWFSIFFFYNYLSIKKIKFAYILCYSFIFIGSLVYVISIFYGQGHYKFRAFILGGTRLLIGLGSNPMMGKKYITLYTPKYYLPQLSKIYLIIELSGLILGPSIGSLLSFIRIGDICCLLNCIGYYGILGSIILIIINIIFFVPPKDPKFSVLLNQKNDDVNVSSSQYVQNDLDDNEDAEDKEFYRMQKERKERRKAGLEPTKSDDVNIEVNDNDPTKSNVGINNTESITNFKDEKEDDDSNSYKIIKSAGEDQNAITNNYYNVDMGRFSLVDISNERKDTIEEIEKKLYAYQERSNFTYINMVPRTLEDITSKEKKTFGYMNINFVIMLILLFFNNLIKENLMIYSSYYILYVIYENGNILKNFVKDESIIEYSQKNRSTIQIIGLLISGELILQVISIFFIMPFYKVNVIFKKNLIIFMVASIVFMIPFLVPAFAEIPWFVYVPFVSIDILLHKIIEVICCCYLVYLIPPQWKYSHIRASSLPIYLMTFGKMLACVICFVCYENKEIVFVYNQFVLTLIAIVSYCILGLIIYKSNNFRVKALSRVLRKKAIE